MMAREATSVEVGGDHPFWDVYPSDRAYRKTHVRRDDMGSISVEVEADGSLRFNNGYEPGSDEHAAERALFDHLHDDIVEEVARIVESRFADIPHYAAFLAEHRPDGGPRP